MKKGRVFADFKKESALYGNNYYEKEESRPYSFARLVYRKSGKWIQKESTPKKSVYLSQSSNNVFMNTVKKSRLIELTLSRIFLFWIQALWRAEGFWRCNKRWNYSKYLSTAKSCNLGTLFSEKFSFFAQLFHDDSMIFCRFEASKVRT